MDDCTEWIMWNVVLHWNVSQAIIWQATFWYFKRFSLIHNQKYIFTLWAFAFCLLQASSDWRWLAVDGVSAVWRSERMGMYVEDKFELLQRGQERTMNRNMAPLNVNVTDKWRWRNAVNHHQHHHHHHQFIFHVHSHSLEP